MTSSTARSGSMLVRQKLMPPGLPSTVIARPRLDDLYSRLLAGHETLAVFAAAGSGKTVQTQQFASREQWPLVWLTLDGADRSASRVLSYLAEGLRPNVSGIDEILDWAFANKRLPAEVAALLAEAIQAERLLVVFDQCEFIAESAASCLVVQTFIEHLPHGIHSILLSREEMNLSLGRLLLDGRAGRITDGDLAVTLDEAVQLTRARGDNESNVSSRLEAARGWIAAVAFGAFPESGGYSVRDLDAYLEREVLQTLPADECRFLLDTSVLDAVSLRAAQALCGPDCGSVWRKVGLRHLPATSATDGTIIYHPLFRRFLHEQLELDPCRLVLLQNAHAEYLVETNHFEEAVELFLSLGELDRATEVAERAFGGLLERGDYETTLRWIHALGVERVGESPPLLGAEIAALRGARRLDEARTLALRLHASGRLAPVVEAEDAVIAHVAWSMLFQPREGLDLLDRYPTSSRALSVRYMLETTSGIDPAIPPQRVQPNETDRLMSWALMVQGRLDELVAMLPSEDQWPPRTPYTTPHPLLGLVWRGELERARALLDDVPSDVKQRIEYDVWNYLEAWLLLAEGDAEGALVAAEFAVAHSRITGFGFEPVFQIVQGEALLSLDRVEEAVTVLSETIENNRASGLLAYTEWGLTYLGRARLLENRNQEAVELLREAVEGMTRGQRLLLLPAAAIYLAEAERRLGNEACSDSAAAIAYSTSLTMGAFTPLRRALTQFPEVAYWVLERDSTPTIEWRRLLRSFDSTAARTPAVARSGAVFDILPFGISPDIVVDGDAANVRRLKVMELACFLSAHPKGVTREEAQIHLFPESDRQRGSNYFRQVVYQLRKSTGLTLQRLPGSRIAFPDDVRVDAADIRFERVLAEASSAGGHERLMRLREALDLPVGPYLFASDLEWVSERRFQLDILIEEAELDAARLALGLRDFTLARHYSESALDRNRYSVPAYRCLMETQVAVGSETAALAIYRRACDALRDIGIAPGDATMTPLLRLLDA